MPKSRFTTAVLISLLLAGLAGAHPRRAAAQEGFDFWISEALLKRIVKAKSVVVPVKLDLKGRSNVHALKSDCELHVGAAVDPPDATGPEGWVVEPAYICKNPPPEGTTWTAYFDENFVDQDDCEVEGFPRILDEHLHGSASPSNPHHAFEVHPATKITCGGESRDFTALLGFHEGMSEIKPASAASCFQMTVEVRRNKPERRYEFRVNRPPNCGNFFSFEMSIYSEWIRALNIAADVFGGHSALARVRPAGTGSSETLKIYTIPGTAEDALLETWRKEWKNGEGDPHHGAFFHGLTTIDFFAVWKAVTNANHQQLAVTQWKEVRFPLAMIVFGSVPDPDPQNDEGFEEEDDEGGG